MSLVIWIKEIFLEKIKFPKFNRIRRLSKYVFIMLRDTEKTKIMS